MTPLFVLLMVGVALSKHHGNHGNVSPITKEDEARICADLCTSGLGGEPCGPVCQDLTPNIPRQSLNNSQDVKTTKPRRGVCPILCENKLGMPLCECENIEKKSIDFMKICDFYCKEQHWLLRGCPHCATKQNGVRKQNGRIMNYEYSEDIDWGKWCDNQCAQANGGSACNCDILPFSLKVK